MLRHNGFYKIMQTVAKNLFFAVILCIFVSPDVWAQKLSRSERKDVAAEYYSNLQQVDVSAASYDILLNLGIDYDGSIFKAISAMNELSEYTTEKGYNKGVKGIGDSRIKNAAEKALKNLQKLREDGRLSAEDYTQIENEITYVFNEATRRANEVLQQTNETRREKRLKEDIVEFETKTLQQCPTTKQLKAKYNSGCWSCLVMEHITSAFLYAADKGLVVTQRAGLVLLWIGTAIWLAFWALKNISSFTELQIGNILNDLIKFLFKVAVAYWFIFYGCGAISQYFITPIMGLGATIGQQFWSEEVRDYTQDFVWEDEYISQEDQENLEAALSVANQPSGQSSSADASATAGADGSSDTAAESLPSVVEPDKYEETVQQFQKALVAILQRYLQEIQNSCIDSPYVSSSSPKCRQTDGGGKRCRHYSSCDDRGHRNYIRQIYKRAGSQGEGAYCMMTITAALEELNDQVGGDITNFQTGKGYCLDGIKVGSQYENSAIVGTNGGDVDLMSAIRYANVGDIVYIRVSGALAGSTGSGSGYHATTHLGGGRLISFNGDGMYNSPASFTSNPVGKIVRFSEVVRQRLKDNPNAKIDKQALASLASGAKMPQSLVNYQGGSYTGFTSAGTTQYDSLIPEIPAVKYTGPTNIMPESVMNSILGAMRAINYKVSDIMVLGNSIMCYATVENGGAWKIFGATVPNGITWLSGFIILCLGFLLVFALAYYFLDISFKIGFAVLAFPIVMGLWPFKITGDKVILIISIIAKAAAFFAFLALTTSFGMALLNATLNQGGLDSLFNDLDIIAMGYSLEVSEEELNKEISDKIYLFSPLFVMLIFALFYFYNLVKSTSSDLVNKFFPDKAFGDSSPMHSTATMMTSFAHKMAMKAPSLVGDIAANQLGVGAKKVLNFMGSSIVHPKRTAKGIASKFRKKSK